MRYKQKEFFEGTGRDMSKTLELICLIECVNRTFYLVFELPYYSVRMPASRICSAVMQINIWEGNLSVVRGTSAISHLEI